MKLSMKRWLIAAAACIYILILAGRAYQDNKSLVAPAKSRSEVSESEKRFARDMRILLDEIDWRLSLSKSGN